MNVFKFTLIALKRDWLFGELRLIGLSILIAVACLSSVNFFTDRVRRATEQQATELLAADLVLVSSQKINQNYITQAIEHNLLYSLNESFRSVVMHDDKLELAEVKAVDNQYPIRGKLRTSEVLFAKEQVTDSIPEAGTVWVDSRLLQALSIEVGDSIQLGASRFNVTKVLTYEPDRGGDLFNIAPRLLMNRIDLEATGLILPGSRVKYRLLFGGSNEAISHFRNQLNISEYDNIRIQDIKEARPEIKTALERAEQFLGLAALVSIALAGLAIAMTSQRYASRHYDNCAIMRCLGLQQKQITQIYLLQLLIIAVIFSLIGCAIGYVAQEGLNQLLAGMTQTTLPTPSLYPVASGLAAGLITVSAFAMPQLMRLRKVSPLRVLRRDLTPVPLNNYVIYFSAFIALMLLSPWQSGSANLTVYTLLGLLLTGLLLAIAAKGMLHLLKKIQPKLKMEARYGLANVVRRSNQSVVQIIGIGMGVTVMLLLTLIRTDLLANWQNRLPPDTPNYFLINVQPDQIETVESFLSKSLSKDIELYPMIRGRLTHINNIAVDIDIYDDQRAKRLASREFNLSYADKMQSDNKLLSGIWWSDAESDEHFFSVEEGIAETLGIKQGDALTYLIGGKELQGKVINLRWVEWDSFNVNFFVVGNPGAFTGFPSTFISSFYMPEDKRSMLLELLRQFPSITVFDVDAILSQVRSIMDQVVRTVEFVFVFTLLTGLIVLFAALQATHDERTQETALMRSLGANKKQILSGLVAEFLCLGLVTGILSAFAATVIEIMLAEFVFKIDIIVSPLVWIVAPLVCCTILVFTGLIGTRAVLSSSPMLTLRRV